MRVWLPRRSVYLKPSQVKPLQAHHYQTLDPVQLDIPPELARGLLEAGHSLLYAPVFIDLQINGYGGVNFSDSANLTPERIYQVIETLWSHGVAYCLPTITTSSFENIQQSLVILTASRSNSVLQRSIVGYHLEGPYISSIDGPRGAHPIEHARPPSWDEFLRWQDIAQGLIKLVTLAPELPGAIAFIEKLLAENIIPAIGHTNATTDDIQQAVDAGAVLSTHLGNGAHAQIRRHPNYIWDQLAQDDLWASLIADGFHLPPNVFKVMVRAKGSHKSILVTDAVTIAGLPPGHYNNFGKQVELTSEGVVKLSGTDYLAGAALKMSDAIYRAAQFADITPDIALNMASYHPKALLEQHTDVALTVLDANTFTLLDWGDDGLHVHATVIDGKPCFSQTSKQRESDSR